MRMLSFSLLILLLFDAVAFGIKLRLRKKILSIDGFNGIRKETDAADDRKVIGSFGEE